MTFKILRQFYSTSPETLREISITRRFTQNDLDAFANLTGDKNMIHTPAILESERKVHGAFLNAVVAGIIGTKLPGHGTIVLSQKLSFPCKCQINKDVKITVRLESERKIAIARYDCVQDGKIVFEGEAKLRLKK